MYRPLQPPPPPPTTSHNLSCLIVLAILLTSTNTKDGNPIRLSSAHLSWSCKMSERKVLTKYYPPDFDPRQLQRKKHGPKPTGPRVQTVRLMAPFSMKCTSCGEYIYKGRKFNARKETPENERYLGIQIYRFYIRCTRCSSEITFKTDPKNQDYTCERGAKRSTEPWRRGVDDEETDEQRLDRLEREEEERNAMEELEAKTVDARREMAVADALDEIRTRNARLERADRGGLLGGEASALRPEADDRRRREEEEDAAAWARAQEGLEEAIEEAIVEEEEERSPALSGSGSNGNGASSAASPASSSPMPPPPLAKKVEEAPPAPAVKRRADDEAPAPSFKRQVKKRKEVLLPGLKKKPSLV